MSIETKVDLLDYTLLFKKKIKSFAYGNGWLTVTFFLSTSLLCRRLLYEPSPSYSSKWRRSRPWSTALGRP